MITITNKNIYFNEFSISSLSSLDKIDIIPEENIINFLSEEVELGESVTFKRLFDIVSHNFEEFNEIFFSSLGGYPLDPYLQEIENDQTEKYESDYLEIYWHCDRYENELTMEPSLHGVSNKTNDRYAMDFVSLNNLKNYNVRINRKVELFDYNKFKDKDEENTRLYIGDKSFTLFELYDCIFSEISFFGGPQDKTEKFKELEESIIEVEKDLDESSNLINFEEMIDNIDNDNIYLVKYKELRDTVEEDRLTNNKNLDKLKNCLLEKLKIYDIIENSDIDLHQYYKKITDIEYNMQILYGEKEDISEHRFWETPKCTCPKIDNLEIFPSDNPIFYENCPIHKKMI
jgi:hypothetical protein